MSIQAMYHFLFDHMLFEFWRILRLRLFYVSHVILIYITK